MKDADKLTKIEKQIAKDVHRLAELQEEMTRIVKRIHLLGMEQGAIKTYLLMTEKETDK